jgi:DNA-directed RNA polymerase specialized sigma24 family protein
MADTGDDFRELLHRVCEGSEDAARELVTKYEPSLRRAIRRVFPKELRSKFDSLDMVQVVLGSFFRKRGQRDDIETPAQLAAFLAGVAENGCGHFIRWNYAAFTWAKPSCVGLVTGFARWRV